MLVAQTAKHTVTPKEGFSAIKIAVAVWEPIYGEAKIADEKPYSHLGRMLTNPVVE